MIKDLIKKSIAASFLIALGDYALLKLGTPLGPIIFAFGLLGVCYLGLNLFTGKCGFLFEERLDPLDLTIILLVNLLAIGKTRGKAGTRWLVPCDKPKFV